MGRRAKGRLLRSWVWILSLCLSWSSISWCYKEKVRLNFPGGGGGGRGKGGGVGGGGGGGEIMSNGIREPSCEELRAMWRYHKRQSRAELNQITAFEDFWTLSHKAPPVIQGFGPIKLKGLGNSNRGRNRGGGLYGSAKPLYGQAVSFGSSNPPKLRPMDKVILALPPKEPPGPDSPPYPILTFNSPPIGNYNNNDNNNNKGRGKSSFEQVRQLLQEEREAEMRGGGGGNPRVFMGGSEGRLGEGGRFGTLVMSPPDGGDGRVVNKAVELMSPFERLRFGHVPVAELERGGGGGDDAPLIYEESGPPGVMSKRGLFYYPIRATRVKDRTTTTTVSPPLLPPRPSLTQHPSLPTVFSFWQRQLAPQEPPPALRMRPRGNYGAKKNRLGKTWLSPHSLTQAMIRTVFSRWTRSLPLPWFRVFTAL